MLNLAFAGLQIGIGIYDKDGRLTTCNDEFDKLRNAYPLDLGALKRTIGQKQPRKEVVAKDDGIVLESYVVPCTDDKGMTNGYIFRLSDISQMKKRESERELEEIFLDNVSHEIRTPLNAIIGFNDLLNGVSGLHMDEAERLVLKDHISKNADRLMSVVDDILDLSKMEKGKLPLHKTVVSLMEVCYKARESVKHEVNEGVQLLHEYPVALKDTFIYTDARRLQQVIHNFLQNACHHTYGGTITLKVRKIDNEETGRPRLRIRVDDTGVGIPTEQRDLLFMPFRKLDGKSEGLGMGLAICRQIAQMFGGKAYLDDTYTGGSSFVFEMPMDEV